MYIMVPRVPWCRDRRTYLATAAVTLGAGCASDSEEVGVDDDDTDGQQTAATADEEAEQSDPDGGETSEIPGDDQSQEDEQADDEQGSEGDQEDQDAPEEEGQPAGEPAIEVIEHELVADTSGITEDVYVEAIVENTGDAASGQVELNADWFNPDGNYLDDDRAYLRSLPAGDTWEARIYALAYDSDDVGDYELSGEFDTDPVAFDPEGLSLEHSEMLVGENEVSVQGEITNNADEEQSYVEATVLISDADGIIMDSERTNASDVPPGETWAFEVTWRGRDRVDRAERMEVLIADVLF